MCSLPLPYVLSRRMRPPAPWELAMSGRPDLPGEGGGEGLFRPDEAMPVDNSGFVPVARPKLIQTKSQGQRGKPFQPEDGRPSWRLALASILGFWIIYFNLATARAVLSDMPAQGEMLIRRLIVTMVAVGLTALLYLLLRRFDRLSTGRLLALAFAASVPLAVAYATVNYIAFYQFPIAEHIELTMDHGKPRMSALAMIGSSALEWYFFIASWAVMWVALSYSAKVRAVERQAADYARAAKDSELRALRYQVNPHFLFNTLNSLSSLVMRERLDEAERMILNLSTFFRASLTREASEDLPLAEELRLQLLYLDIEKVRFPDRLIVNVHVPDALYDALVPALILQPLVENAIKYGVSRSTRPVNVTISATAFADRLELIVSDDGEPLAKAGHGPGSGFGVGLANVTARLQARYGDDAECVAGHMTGGGWRVRLTMPLFRQKSYS